MNDDNTLIIDLINILSFVIGIQNYKSNEEQVMSLENHLNSQDEQYKEIINLLKELKDGRK